MTIEEFINDNVELIDSNEWEEFYDKAVREARLYRWKVGEITDMLLSAQINPLDTIKRVPQGYLNQSKLTKLEIPVNIEVIGWYAFYYSNLNKVIVPKSIKKIEGGAFSNMLQECEIIYEGSMEDFKDISIDHENQFKGRSITCIDGVIKNI